MSTTIFVIQLPKEVQEEIRKMVWNALWDDGYRGDELESLVDNAVCDRLCNLSEIVLKRKPDASYEDFMREDFKAISGCTHIALLEGWETSAGARSEKAEAERLGLAIMFYRIPGGKE